MIVFILQIIRIAFELFDYIDTINSIYFVNISTKIIVNNIVINFFKSTSLSIINHSISTNIVYSAKWIVDKIRFRKNFKIFVIVIETYRNNQSFLDWISDRITSFIFDLKSTIANIFFDIFYVHFSKNLRRKFQIISSTSFFQRRNNIIISLNIIFRNTKNIEFIFAFNTNMTNKNNN